MRRVKRSEKDLLRELEELKGISVNGVPVVATIKDKKPGLWVVLCPFCGSLHRHGASKGPRDSHCGGGGSYSLLPARQVRAFKAAVDRGVAYLKQPLISNATHTACPVA